MSALSGYITTFESYLKNEKQVSSNTLVSYMRDINQFSEWLSLRGEKGLGDISQRDIEEYLGKLKNAGKSSATLSRCAASLKCFFTAAVEAGLTKKNPVSKVNLDKQSRKLPQILTSKEVSCFSNSLTPQMLRNKGQGHAGASICYRHQGNRAISLNCSISISVSE